MQSRNSQGLAPSSHSNQKKRETSTVYLIQTDCFCQEKWGCRDYHNSTADLAGCTISSALTSLVTDFRSTSDGLTRDSSFSPKLQHERESRPRISPNDPASFRHLQINPSRALNPPRATHLWIRLFIDPSGALPNPTHALFICASRPTHQKAQIQATPRGPAPHERGEGRAWEPRTLSATKSTTASAFSGAVRDPEEMPRQRSLRVGRGRAPSAAGAAAEARGRAKHQARPLTGKTTTRACIARRGATSGSKGGTARGRDGGDE